MRPSTRLVLAVFLALTPTAPLAADGIRIRVTPPDQTQLVQTQRVDLRVEATATDSGGVVSSLTVLIDGTDVTCRGVLTAAGSTMTWAYRAASFGRVRDDTEAFPEILNAYLGTYPIPSVY